jgi:hypothetical protein
VLIIDGPPAKSPSTPRPTPARLPQPRARAGARTARARPPAQQAQRTRDGSTSPCWPTPNRRRTSPRRMRWAPPAGPVPHRIPVPAARHAAHEEEQFQPTAMRCWAWPAGR